MASFAFLTRVSRELVHFYVQVASHQADRPQQSSICGCSDRCHGRSNSLGRCLPSYRELSVEC